MIQRWASLAALMSVILSAVALVRSADLEALRAEDAQLKGALEMETRERERLDDYLRQYRDLQERNTARIDILDKEAGR